MNKQQAAEKLINLFGDMNIIGVLHSILVETSKYIIIILFAIYTWHCFTVFIGRNKEREQRVYARQQKMMFAINQMIAPSGFPCCAIYPDIDPMIVGHNTHTRVSPTPANGPIKLVFKD